MQAKPPDQTMEYVKLAVAFLGGGFMGAVLTNIVQWYRNRVQRVRYRIKTTSLFRDGIENRVLSAKVTLTENGTPHQMDNLFLSELVVTNTGNQHIPEITIGVTMDGSAQMVNMVCDAPDRHHVATAAKSPTPAARSQEADYVLKPFNRGDIYRFQILSTCPRGEVPGEITLSSNAGVRFIVSQSLTEALESSGYSPAAEFLLKAVAQVAGIKIRS